ncbi:MAG: LamG domain-containing protein [Chloroflexota bacterium]
MKHIWFAALAFGLFLSLLHPQGQAVFSAPLVQSYQTSLRFFGTGSGDIDRVKIPLDNPHRSVDVGDDFTIEFWLKAVPGSNTSAGCQESTSQDTWTNGNIILDRDIFGDGDYGDYGVSLAGGRIAFGVAVGSSRRTICGTSDLRDGQWHHIAITRQNSSGQMRIFVNGQLQKSQNGPIGNLSYRDGRGTFYSNSDPYLVIAAEKHDYDPGTYPSFTGWIDELRISSIIRYTSSFTPPAQPFTADSATVTLYHFDNTPAACTGQVNDSSGQNNHGDCKFGGSAPNQGPQYVLDSPFTSSIIYNHEIHLPLVRR